MNSIHNNKLSINNNIQLTESFTWVKLSWLMFREYPIHFISLTLIGFIIAILPLISPLLLFSSFCLPLFASQFMSLADKISKNNNYDNDESILKFSELFKGFFSRKTILNLAFINLILNISLILLEYGIKALLNHFVGFNSYFLFTINDVLYFFLTLMLQLALWLSPVICTMNPEIKPLDAMLLSIKSSFYNIPVFMVYMLIVLAITIVAIIPFGIGLLVVLPMLQLSPYFIYKTIFK